MSGGDLLYILAFIILPTAVLVSCIWALILLRKGVLLPARPRTAHDISQPSVETENGADTRATQIEETGEHTVVAVPASRVTTATNESAAVRNDSPRTGSDKGLDSASGDREGSIEGSGPDVVVQALKVDDAVPLAERTQEMTALPVDAPAATNAGADTLANRPGAEPRDDLVDAGRNEGEMSANEADMLMVPLDEPAPDANRIASGDPVSLSEAATSPGSRDDEVLPEVSQRRPTRRIVKSTASDNAAARARPRVGQRRGQREQSG